MEIVTAAALKDDLLVAALVDAQAALQPRDLDGLNIGIEERMTPAAARFNILWCEAMRRVEDVDVDLLRGFTETINQVVASMKARALKNFIARAKPQVTALRRRHSAYVGNGIYSQIRKDQGIKKLTLHVHVDDVETLRKMAADLFERRGITISTGRKPGRPRVRFDKMRAADDALRAKGIDPAEAPQEEIDAPDDSKRPE